MEDNYTFPTTDGIERQIRKWRGIEIDTIQEFLKDKCLLDETCRGETMADLYEAYHSNIKRPDLSRAGIQNLLLWG